MNWKDVRISEASSTVAPGIISVTKKVLPSAKAISVISSQAANTANRTTKLAGRIETHKNEIKNTVATQAARQGEKQLTKCVVGGKNNCND
jgi:uncharacterized membrane protein